MCNQTEMWKEIAEYDRRAAHGKVPPRGIRNRNPDIGPKLKEKIRKAILQNAEGKGVSPKDLLDWFAKNLSPKVSESLVKECWTSLLVGQELELTPDRLLRLRKRQSPN